MNGLCYNPKAYIYTHLLIYSIYGSLNIQNFRNLVFGTSLT